MLCSLDSLPKWSHVEQKYFLFTDLEAPTPTPNRDQVAAHFTFDLPHTYPDQQSRGQFINNPEYFDTYSTESDATSSSKGAIPKNSRRKVKSTKPDYYNDVNELYSDGGSARGSSTESTTSI